MNNVRRILTAAVCAVAVSTAVHGQELYGGQTFGRPLYGMPVRMGGIGGYGHFLDSVTFVRRLKDSLWLRPVISAVGRERRVPEVPMSVSAMSTVVPAAGGMPVTRYPYAADYRWGGMIAAWQGGALFGSGSHMSMPGLMSVQNATLGVTQTFGNLTVTAAASADRAGVWRAGAMPYGAAAGMGTLNRGTYYTFGGAMTYRFSDNISATVFGRYSTNRSFYSMAALPYMGTSGYGGFLTFMGETFGMDVGVERYYDTFSRRWITSPIVTPKIRFSEKFTLELPVGPLVKDLIDNAVHNRKHRGGPMIMPQGLPSVGEIPFGTPETPR